MQEELKKLSDYIEDNKIFLRHVNLNDAEAMFEYTQDVDNVYWVTINPQKDISETKLGIENYFLKIPLGKYGIFLKSENKLIGTIDLRDHENSFEIGYILNKKYQSQGYATRALNLLITEAFTKTKVKEIVAIIDVKNDKSNNLINKFGFTVKNKFEKLNPKFNEKRQYFLWSLNREKWNKNNIIK